MSVPELVGLAENIRSVIIDVMSENPGHFGASMGAVELTIALHRRFNTPVDKLVWDVGHQAYAHKLLTGRKVEFESIRNKAGISGFPKISESEFDAFGTGHSSTSISAALGMAEASLLLKEDTNHVAIIGDGALTGGMSFEALSNAALSNSNLLIVVNDNGMSIDENVGGMSQHLSNINPYQNIFYDLGLDYNGPIDGHNLHGLIEELSKDKYQKGVHVIHVKTIKGKGFEPAEKGDQTIWHAPGKFNRTTGVRDIKEELLPPNYQDVFGETLIELAKLNSRIVAVTPAMGSGSGLSNFAKQFPDRFFDVGIAEQHAVTFSAGIAAKGMVPFCSIYSTFLQRGYDQLIHDVALQNLHVIFCVDRAGLAGNDGATHQGAFDLAFLNPIPNLKILAPMNELQLRDMLNAAVDMEGPVVIRYPRGRGVHLDYKQPFRFFEIGKGRKLNQGSDIAVLSIGHVGNFVHEAIVNGANVSHYDMRCLKPLDQELLMEAFSKHQHIITIEDGSLIGGFSTSILSWKNENGFDQKIHSLGIPDSFIEHGTQDELYAECGIDTSALEVLLNSLY